MIVSETGEKYRKYHEQGDYRWDFGNSVLYRMCEEYPCHDNEDVIAGKIWLIGRSYAAAIERRKTGDDYNGDDFYFDVVAPSMKEVGKELDSRIDRFKKSKKNIADDLENILSTHRILVEIFREITGLEKRSLASKYLHFHCPEKFFIYDSRAKSAIRKIVTKPDKKILSGISEFDPEYADFVCRMIELQQFLEGELGVYELPRKLDGFLLAKLN